MTLTDRLLARLKKIPDGGSIKLSNGEAGYVRQQSWRHAARTLGVKISIKTTPDGVRLYRIQ